LYADHHSALFMLHTTMVAATVVLHSN